jgi:hypothetical protein
MKLLIRASSIAIEDCGSSMAVIEDKADKKVWGEMQCCLLQYSLLKNIGSYVMEVLRSGNLRAWNFQLPNCLTVKIVLSGYSKFQTFSSKMSQVSEMPKRHRPVAKV